MRTREHWQPVVGTWTGTSRLFLPDEPIRESPATAAVTLLAQGTFCTLAYTWVFDGAPQDGLMLWGYDAAHQTVDAVFVDSWHMGDTMLRLQGVGDARASLVVHGTYAVPASPDWGWRIEVAARDTTLRVAMYNVPPDGDALLGVDASYTRSA